MSRLTSVIKRNLPAPVVDAVRTYRGRSRLKAFAGLPTKELFTKIYEEDVWGTSHDPDPKILFRKR